MTSQEAWLVLNAIPGMTGAVFKKLLQTWTAPEDIVALGRENLLDQGLNPQLVTNIIHFPKDKFLEAEYNLLRNEGVSIVTLSDESYPDALRDILGPPPVLYMKGNADLLGPSAIAMVGARKASSYGVRTAQQFASEFAQAGFMVISGGASGIDTASHQGCLKANGQTIAILGCGLAHIYPAENRGLFENIAQSGLLVSEFSMNTAPFMYNFPRRNRIISALSLATVVVEAARRSGSLITADYALEQNKQVFAVPGNIDSSYSQGTNFLLQEGAKMALSAKDVLEQLGVEIKDCIEQERSQEKKHIHLSTEEFKVYELIPQEPEHIDAICARYGEDISGLMGQMLNLELKGAVKQLPGQYYVRT